MSPALPTLVAEQPLDVRLQEVLSRYVSRINARVIAERGLRVLGRPDLIAEPERARFLVALRTAAALFVTSTSTLDQLEKALETEVIGTAAVEARVVAVESEDDLRMARVMARDMALALKGSSLAAQRVATVVSELGRNIVSYTPGGSIRFEPGDRCLRIIATDCGKGIPNLQEILDGRYRSKTGLGKGLLGIKQLMEHFDVQTGPTGTRIVAEAAL